MRLVTSSGPGARAPRWDGCRRGPGRCEWCVSVSAVSGDLCPRPLRARGGSNRTSRGRPSCTRRGLCKRSPSAARSSTGTPRGRTWAWERGRERRAGRPAPGTRPAGASTPTALGRLRARAPTTVGVADLHGDADPVRGDSRPCARPRVLTRAALEGRGSGDVPAEARRSVMRARSTTRAIPRSPAPRFSVVCPRRAS